MISAPTSCTFTSVGTFFMVLRRMAAPSLFSSFSLLAAERWTLDLEDEGEEGEGQLRVRGGYQWRGRVLH